MKTIFVLFDSLNKRYLSSYGCDNIHTPNFDRLSNRSITFDNCFVGSMPCMPARRDFQTGRLSFLHRSWGPMEPYDNSLTQILSQNGVYTHLISDHIHYWEEGGANYHTKYDSWEIVRGQEGDKWVPMLEKPSLDGLMGRRDIFRQYDMNNRAELQKRGEYPIDQIKEKALTFLGNNHDKDNWFLQVESFDPHEPFFAHQKFRDMYNDNYGGKEFDWPDYKMVDEKYEEIEHCKNEYRALVTACDEMLGSILDVMDEKNMWGDTMLIVTTDHGYLLGEHNWWAKTVQPMYSEVSATPLLIYNPKINCQKRRSSQIVQMTDFAPTILREYNLDVPTEMTGVAIDFGEEDGAKREKKDCIFGIHGCYMNYTDGNYLYMKRPVTNELFNYTLMPSNMKTAFPLDELRQSTLCQPFNFTKGLPQLKVPTKPWAGIDFDKYGDLIFDLKADFYCNVTVEDEELKSSLDKKIVAHMKKNDAPIEAYSYWNLKK